MGTALPGHVLIGGYTSDGDEGVGGLTSWRPRPDGGGLDVVDRLALTNPTYLVAHPSEPWLFVAGETDEGRVSSVRLNEDGTLDLISTVGTGGSGSCHVAVAADRRHVLVADYGSGSLCSVPIEPDGGLRERSGFWQFDGSGPDAGRQEAPHAHQVLVDGAEVLVADLGTDRIHRLRLGEDGTLSLAGPAVLLPPGSGPRHAVIVEDHLVVATELSGELWLGRRASGGGWTELDRVPCTASPEHSELSPSALRADGDTVLVANRGPGTIAAFALDRRAGTLRLIEERAGGGRSPRDLVVTDTLLWVANQTDDVVTVLARDAEPGAEPVLSVSTPAPACVLLVAAAGDNLGR